MRWLWLTLGIGTSMAAAGCSNAPFCSEFVDITGRPAVFCPGGRDEPVCNLPDEQARFELSETGYRLVGARRASCTADREVVCPPDTVGEAYCILDPEL